MRTSHQALSPSIYTRLSPRLFEEVKRRATRNERTIAAEIRFLVRQALEGSTEPGADETAAESA